MSNNSAKAQRYAQAVYSAMVEKWQAALDDISEKLSKDDKLFASLMDGSTDFEERVKLLNGILPKDVPAELSNLLKLLLQEEDLDLVDDVSDALAQVASGKQAPVEADITSAVELTEKQKDALRTSVAEQHGDDLIFRFEVDPSLMGGLRVRVGDRLIDTSVASRLAALRESLSSIVR